MANTMMSAAVRKRLVKELKYLEDARDELKSQKVVDLELYKDIKKKIEYIKETLSFFKK